MGPFDIEMLGSNTSAERYSNSDKILQESPRIQNL